MSDDMNTKNIKCYCVIFLPVPIYINLRLISLPIYLVLTPCSTMSPGRLDLGTPDCKITRDQTPYTAIQTLFPFIIKTKVEFL